MTQNVTQSVTCRRIPSVRTKHVGSRALPQTLCANISQDGSGIPECFTPWGIAKYAEEREEASSWYSFPPWLSFLEHLLTRCQLLGL